MGKRSNCGNEQGQTQKGRGELRGQGGREGVGGKRKCVCMWMGGALCLDDRTCFSISFP